MALFTLFLAISFKLQLLGIGIFAFLAWVFVLRKYRSLGLRMFFSFSMIATLMSCWLCSDIQDEKSMQQNGKLLTATVLEKTKIQGETATSAENLITVSFQFPAGKMHAVSTSTYISNDEFKILKIGQHIDVLYNPVNEQIYYTVSFDRYKNQQWIFYVLPVFFLLIGVILGLICRKYEVGIHEDTGDEYLEKDGNVILDEKGNRVARVMKRANIASKLFQAFK